MLTDAPVAHPVGQVAVGMPGHFSVAVGPDAADVTALVGTNLLGLRRLGAADSAAQGLDFMASYGNTVGIRQVRHTCTA